MVVRANCKLKQEKLAYHHWGSNRSKQQRFRWTIDKCGLCWQLEASVGRLIHGLAFWGAHNTPTYLKCDVSRCEVRSANAEGWGCVRCPCIACSISRRDFGHISARSLQSNAPLALGYHYPFTAMLSHHTWFICPCCKLKRIVYLYLNSQSSNQLRKCLRMNWKKK